MKAGTAILAAMNMNDRSTSDSMPSVKIYTDGGCDPNPGGPGGYGVVLLHSQKRTETSGGFRSTTNNRMEIYAAIKGLESLTPPCQVTLYSDSQYLVNAIMKGWAMRWKKNGWWLNKKQRAKNIDLWEKLLPLCQANRVELCWVKGHAGIPENERCDQLSAAALRQPNLPADEGYEDKSVTEGGRPAMQAGERCRKCSTPVIQQTPQKQPGRDYDSEPFLLCPQCQTRYQVEAAKRLVAQPLLRL
jgi:ribonuclease HI